MNITDKDLNNISGRNRSTVKLTEDAFNVVIDIGNKGQLRISGRENDVAKAKQDIIELISGEEISVNVSPALIQALFAQKGSHKIKIENDYRVKVVIEKEAGLVRMRGAKVTSFFF